MKKLIKKSFSKIQWDYETNMDLTFKKVIFVFILFFISQIAIGTLVGVINKIFPSLNIDYMLLNIILNLLLILAIPVIYSYKNFVLDFFGKNFISSKVIQSGIFYGFVAIFVNLIIGSLLFYLYSVLNLNPTQQQVVQLIENTDNINPILVYFGIAISAPLAEELFFRGIVYRTFAKKISLRNGILFTSILFSLLHFDLFYIPQIFLISIVFSLAYNETGSILTPIIAHLISNSLFIIPFLLSI